MKVLLIFTTIVILSFSNMFAQAPDTLWTRTYGGSGQEWAYSIKQTADGGYIITGFTTSYGAGDDDMWLIKTNASGDTVWTKTFGGSDSDYGSSVHQTADGGYIITGRTSSYGAGGSDMWLIKTNASGDTVWTKTFGGSDSDYGSSVHQTADGGYIITGRTSSYGAGGSDMWLIKTNALGDTLWTKTYGGSSSEAGYSVYQINDGGGYIITGHTYSYGAGDSDVWLIKTNALGDTLWTKTFGGVEFDVSSSVQQTNDGGFIISGSKYFDMWLIKTNTLGNTVWTKTFGRSSPYTDRGYSVQQTADNGYILSGVTNSYGAGGDMMCG